MKYGEVEVQLKAILTSVLGHFLASLYRLFRPVTHCITGWEIPRTGFEEVTERKVPALPRTEPRYPPSSSLLIY
jgi:hypothetical protein